MREVGHRYDGVLALEHVSLRVGRGSFNAVLGPNGAGKSTLAQIMAGLLEPTSGTTVDGGEQRRGAKRPGSLRHGVSLVPEGRRLFGQLTIEENLVVAAYGAALSAEQTRARLRALAPILPDALRDGLRSRYAVSLSGGERQIVALVRALMSRPALIIIDEPSLGLAPVVTEKVYGVLSRLRAEGVAVVVVEQIATHAAEHADVLHLLSRGKIVYSGPSVSAEAQEAIRLSYVGPVEA